MDTKKRRTVLVALAGLASLVGLTACDQKVEQEAFEPNWSSLRKHDMPEWMDGMKFGIYCHWGPQMVKIQHADQGMGTIEAIEHWTGENFDAAEWADLFESAGAQFAGPVAWHVTGMLNWDSEITDWNTVDRGPKIDIAGELEREIRKRDMKYIMTFHSSSIWGQVSRENETNREPSDEVDLLNIDFKNRTRSDLWQGWYERITEATDNYQPDMVWVDVGFGGTVQTIKRGRAIGGRLLPEKENTVPCFPEGGQQRFLAHYFNQAQEEGREVEFIYKSYDIPPGVGMRNVENGSLIGLQFDPWMADINMAEHRNYPTPWFYNPKNPMKDANHLVDLLVDMTSKNGRMLLNVPPKPDGTFTENQKTQLKAIGDWLKINGEAIYDTVPWSFFGEGPTEETVTGHHAHARLDRNVPKWTKEDIRFTQKGKDLYAIVLDWPGKELRVRALGFDGKLYPDDIKSVSLLGSDSKLEWEHTAEALVVKLPTERPCDFAYTLKVERN